MKPIRQCPSCEQIVEVEKVITPAGVAYKCCNCWHAETDLKAFVSVPEEKTGRSLNAVSSTN